MVPLCDVMHKAITCIFTNSSAYWRFMSGYDNLQACIIYKCRVIEYPKSTRQPCLTNSFYSVYLQRSSDNFVSMLCSHKPPNLTSHGTEGYIVFSFHQPKLFNNTLCLCQLSTGFVFVNKLWPSFTAVAKVRFFRCLLLIALNGRKYDVQYVIEFSCIQKFFIKNEILGLFFYLRVPCQERLTEWEVIQGAERRRSWVLAIYTLKSPKMQLRIM